MLSIGLALALSQGAATAVSATAESPTDGAPVTMTAAQIRAYNASLDRADPAYIRCVRLEETGSWVKKRLSCRTNAEWRRVQDVGNQDARDTLDTIQLHQSSRDPSEGLGRP